MLGFWPSAPDSLTINNKKRAIPTLRGSPKPGLLGLDSLVHFAPVEKAAFDTQCRRQVNLVYGTGTLLDKAPGAVLPPHVDTEAGRETCTQLDFLLDAIIWFYPHYTLPVGGAGFKVEGIQVAVAAETTDIIIGHEGRCQQDAAQNRRLANDALATVQLLVPANLIR